MELNFESCVKKGRLVKIKPDLELAGAELKEAEADLTSAKEEIKKQSWKWAVEKAYYTMFHAARALLLQKGLKERRSHRCLILGLKELYIKTGLISRKYLDYIETAKFRREDAIYASRYSKEIAITHGRNAEDFLNVAKDFMEIS